MSTSSNSKINFGAFILVISLTLVLTPILVLLFSFNSNNELVTVNQLSPTPTLTTEVMTPDQETQIGPGSVTILSGHDMVVEDDWTIFSVNGLETGLYSFSFDLPENYSLEPTAPGYYDIIISGETVGTVEPGIFRNNGQACFSGMPDKHYGPSGNIEVVNHEAFYGSRILHKMTVHETGEGRDLTRYDYCFKINSLHSLKFYSYKDDIERWDAFVYGITSGEIQPNH